MASYNTSAINITEFYYPLGNTSAACLTQELEPEEPGKILLLGCGDIRHIIFTAYFDSRVDRHLDFTCCDNQVGILARNVLLLTVLADGCGEDSKLQAQVWDFYSSLYVSEDTLRFLHDKAKELLSLSESRTSWKNGKYNQLVQFCDDDTRLSIRAVWKEYVLDDNKKIRKRTSDQLIARLKNAQRFRDQVSQGSANILRAAAPVAIEAMQDASGLDNEFWSKTSPKCSKALINPTLQPPSQSTAILHYGTSPLLGFHLATAYTPLSRDSPVAASSTSERPQKQHLFNTAQTQIFAWAESFKKRVDAKNLIVRVFVGDAISFSHALNQVSCGSMENRSSCYKDTYKMAPIVFDEDYQIPETSPPTRFNVVDCSNLIDHVGPMNLLLATSPLLLHTHSSSLYTETLVVRGKNLAKTFEKLIPVNFRLVSNLLGLYPVAYSTNATAVGRDEELLDTMFSGVQLLGDKDEGSSRSQMHERLLWKISPRFMVTKEATKLHLNRPDLAQLLYAIYLHLFQGENHALKLRDMLQGRPESIRNRELCRYHRGSFAALCAFFKLHVSADWEKVPEDVLGLVENDTQLMIGINYVQELQVQFHLLGLHTTDFIANPRSFMPMFTKHTAFRAWENLPKVLRVTLVVPREKLSVFTTQMTTPWMTGSPNMHGALQASSSYPGPRFQNFFSAINVAFGKVSTYGERDTADFVVAVENDPSGWRGNSPLIVSFWVPANTLLLEPGAIEASLNLESTPQTTHLYVSKLGFQLQVYKTSLSDTRHVFITKDAPNVDRAIKPAGISDSEENKSRKTPEHNLSIKTNLDSQFEPNELTARVDGLPTSILTLLQSQAEVQIKSEDLFTVSVSIGDGPTAKKLQIRYPLPIDIRKSKTRIARLSGYVEVSVALMDPLTCPLSDAFLIAKTTKIDPVRIWNIPRLRLGCLPSLDFSSKEKSSWLTPHVCAMWSARERKLREKYFHETFCPDARLNFKESLFSMIMRFTGIQGGKVATFGLSHKGRGGVETLIFPLEVRLDVANHTVVLDVVILPLTEHLVCGILARFLKIDQSREICSIPVEDEELTIWKHMIVVWTERCRSWSHKTTCEYLRSNSAPISTQYAEVPICSCGMGQIERTATKHIPGFEIISKYAVRAAISPYYGSPLVENLPSAADIMEMRAGQDQISGCNHCSAKESEDGQPLLVCGRCGKAKYCSKSCQKAAWKAHKQVCKQD